MSGFAWDIIELIWFSTDSARSERVGWAEWDSKDKGLSVGNNGWGAPLRGSRRLPTLSECHTETRFFISYILNSCIRAFKLYEYESTHSNMLHPYNAEPSYACAFQLISYFSNFLYCRPTYDGFSKILFYAYQTCMR